MWVDGTEKLSYETINNNAHMKDMILLYVLRSIAGDMIVD